MQCGYQHIPGPADKVVPRLLPADTHAYSDSHAYTYQYTPANEYTHTHTHAVRRELHVHPFDRLGNVGHDPAPRLPMQRLRRAGEPAIPVHLLRADLHHGE